MYAKNNCIYRVYDCGDPDSFSPPDKPPQLCTSEANRFSDILKEISASDGSAARYENFQAVGSDGKNVCCTVGFIRTSPSDQITVTIMENSAAGEESSFDRLTGLYTLPAFTKRLNERLSAADGSHKLLIVYFDILHFKLINDIFGSDAGDSLLIRAAAAVTEAARETGAGCRIASDRFVLFTDYEEDKNDERVNTMLDRIMQFNLAYEIVSNAGIYVAQGTDVSAEAAVNRAIMAQSVIKGSYIQRFHYYDEELRKKLLTEQEITGLMRAALREEQFVVYYQPQYNHSTGMLVGAEALVRWLHPEKGLIPPGLFIPVFEKNGFITSLDLYVFEKVCVFIRHCIDKNLPLVPISVNLTRYDIFSPNFFERMEEMLSKHRVPSRYVRIEITESAALGNSQFINDAVKKLHSYGFIVEMDDFGSGYSSLNILKDIDFDIIKLDMKFLDKEQGSKNRGGTILSSIVRMVNWLGLPIIAEGVETVRQADFLKSIGCDYIQGYLYSKPLPEEEYETLISGKTISAIVPHMKLIDTLNAGNFWSSDSMETLIFNNFVGGAAIFDYQNNKIEILRINKKYLIELGMNLSERDVIRKNPMDFMCESDSEVYRKMLQEAIETGEEQECETWRTIRSANCGEDQFCIRSSVRMIGQSQGNYLFHAIIRNITAEKKRMTDILDSERRFKMASEQVNIYYWEYTVATKEMRPCFRCMRDLGLPALLTNYPDSAIEMGVFPPETAEMYRDWHRQIEQGVPSLEAIIPLTVGRIPFRVRYTTEFDENGRPIKAYGSAALVIDESDHQS